MTTHGTAIKSSKMTPLATFEATNPTKINWKSYTARKLNNVATFFTNRVRNFYYGCGLGLKQVCHVALVISVLQLAKDKASENTNTIDDHDYNPFFDAYIGALEEVLFRGIVQNCVYGISTRVFNKLDLINVETKAYYTAVIPTSFLFGLSHLSNHKPPFIVTTLTTLSGFQFGRASHCDGLDKAMWAHATYNYIAGWVNLLIRAYTTRK